MSMQKESGSPNCLIDYLIFWGVFFFIKYNAYYHIYNVIGVSFEVFKCFTEIHVSYRFVWVS